jgi:hypothetical protein
LAAGGLALAGIGALAAAIGAPLTSPSSVDPVRLGPSPSVSVRPFPADSLAAVIVARDLFRFGRRPPALRYDPLRELQAPPVAAAPPKPVLILVGIVAGSEPSAVIEGFPGVEGPRVVRVGDAVSGVRVTRIAKHDVWIVGMDTTWVLRVREPWK